MGNTKNDLSWSWPLFRLDWTADIIKAFDRLLEPSWSALERVMTAHVPNVRFSSKILSQGKRFLLETELVKNISNRVFILSEANEIAIKRHLVEYFNNSQSQWASVFKELSKTNKSMNYNDISNIFNELWPRINDYSVFKQWAYYFQYIEYGVLTDNLIFTPGSLVSSLLKTEQVFMNKCIKAIGDPRILTGHYSLHTEAESLIWTKGEDTLPLSEDPNVTPRIPIEAIQDHLNRDNIYHDSWRNALECGTSLWLEMISKEGIKCGVSLNDLSKLIFTCKHILDYFIFGKPVYDSDIVDSDAIGQAKKRWSIAKHIKLPGKIWHIIPNLYKDITRLFWGEYYFRNSLRRPSQDNYYDESIISKHDWRVPIRCSKSKRSLNAIIDSFYLIKKELMKAQSAQQYFEIESRNLITLANNFIPGDAMEISDIISNIENYITLTHEDKTILLKKEKPFLHVECPTGEIIEVCYWLHRYHDLRSSPYLMTLKGIEVDLKKTESNLNKEISTFNNNLNTWETETTRMKSVFMVKMGANYENRCSIS